MERDRMVWGESLDSIAGYVADELRLTDMDVRRKAMGIKFLVSYEYTFTLDGVDVTMFWNKDSICLKSRNSVRFDSDTLGDVVDTIRRLADCEREEIASMRRWARCGDLKTSTTVSTTK